MRTTARIIGVIGVIGVTLLLSGCAGNVVDSPTAGGGVVRVAGAKPRVPAPKKPKIPEQVALANEKAEVNNEVDAGEFDLPDFDRLLNVGKNTVIPQVISLDDIRRGYYFAKREEKKEGTPDTWIWIDDAKSSRWSSPYAVGALDEKRLKDLCESTGGSYLESCLEKETVDCDVRSESQCVCFGRTVWVQDQGCILTDDGGFFLDINRDELIRGWYYGTRNGKKHNTPPSWIWGNDEGGARWKNPPAR